MKTLNVHGRKWVDIVMVSCSLVLGPSLLLAEVVGVSPGAGERFVRVGTQCPTFSWTSEAGSAYELEIYRVDEQGSEIGRPLWRHQLPPGATSWTPAEEKCLDAGGRYAWSVRPIDVQNKANAGAWSETLVFEVSVSSGGGAVPTGAIGLSVESDDPDGAAAALISDVGGRLISGQALGDEVYSVDAEGNVEANSFTGDGSGLGQVLAAGQNCLPGTLLQGLGPDGELICTIASLGMTIVDDPEDPDNFVGGYPSIAIGLDGNPVISHYDFTADSLRVVKCNDIACKGMDETISIVDDDPADDLGRFTSIAIGADGNPVISYQNFTARTLKVAKCNDPACAGMDETITTVDDPANLVGRETSLAIGLDGNPVISYLDETAVTLKVAKCNDPACAGMDETITTVDDPANSVGRYTSIAIGTDGNPVISYHDNTAGALKVAKCNDPACAGMDETITTIDDTANLAGRHTSIAIGIDGNPVISYRDGDAQALKVAKCNDPACEGMDETITIVDELADQDLQATSIAVGPDGNPVISYGVFDLIDFLGVLKLARCNDPDCTGMDETITTVDDPDDSVAAFTSLAIGPDGNPVIGYDDSTIGTLKVVKCADPACLP